MTGVLPANDGFRARRRALGALVCVLCISAATLGAQGPPPPDPRFGPGYPGGPRAGASWWESPWWNGAAARELNLSDAQKTDINSIVKDYRAKMMDLRGAVEKADKDVAAAFGENPVDQKKAGDAIERLAAARGDLTRALSQMSLKLRVVLTAEQWQTLEQRQLEARSGRSRVREGRARRTDEAKQIPPPPNATKQQ